MKLILEQRYLFDGSLGATHHATHTGQHDALHPYESAAAFAAGEVPSATPRAFLADQHQHDAAVTTVLIVDPRVTNWQSLVAGVKPGVDVVVLDPSKDGITQVSQALAGLSGVRNLEFLTDGTQGAITLGGSTLDLATLTARAADITGWSAALSAHADIVFWGCNVGEGSAGTAFLADMHTLTGATIGASTDATGAAALGGDWTLEASTGPLHANLMPFSAASLAGYTGILDTPLPSVTLAATDGTSTHLAANTVLLGDTINLSMNFSNAALNATGFGPYVELFAPTSLALSGVTAAGASATVLSVAVTGGSFTNPLTHLVESAPSGITGGEAYFITLPYGSFTPNEPAVALTASLNLASGLTNGALAAMIGTNLQIDARAGFEYGAAATGSTPILEASAVGVTENVQLVASWISVATLYGEGETATGPDFPVTYTLHLEPAPAVASTGVAITNLLTTVTLPNSVIATGTPVATTTGGDAGTAALQSASALGGTVQTLSIDYTHLSQPQTVTFTAYVPQYYQYTASGETAGAPILDPVTGAAVTVAMNPAYSYTADAWIGDAISASGDIAGAAFAAKSLAVQLVADISDALPTQDIHYTLRFEVSDYFGVANLFLNATLSDGLTFDPTVMPVLAVAGKSGGVSGGGGFLIASSSTSTVNNETVQAGGGGATVSYNFVPASGTTNISFNVAGVLGGIYGAGSVGSVTFAATVLDAYTLGTDAVSGAGGFLRESDTVSASSSNDIATALYDFNGSSYSATGNVISDITATQVDTLPAGGLSLTIVEAGGVAYTGQYIAPGETVVYELTYTLAAPGDFAGLNMVAYLPEPVFTALHPSAPDTNAADYSATASAASFTAASAGTALAALASGSYITSVSPLLTGVTVAGVTASEPGNSVTFNVVTAGNATYDNVTTNAGSTQKVTIDFAVTASSLPFIDGLKLTAQGDSAYTPAQAPVVARQVNQQIQLAEPLILSIDQGVVAVTGNDGSNIGANMVWTQGGAAASAPTLFAPAGGSAVFATTVPSTLVGAQDNLNVANVQGGDTVRIVDVLQNSGHYAAYDLIVKDALAQGFSTANVANLTVTRGDGTVLEMIDPATGKVVTGAAAVADFFAGGLLFATPAGTASPTLAASGSQADIVYITYDLAVPTTVATAASFTGQATIVAYTNQDLFNATGSTYTLTMPTTGADGNFADDTSLHATLSDTATIATLAPAITDSITGASDAADGSVTVPANTYIAHAGNFVPGETVKLSTTISIPLGDSKSVVATDILPTGLTPDAASVVVTLVAPDGTQTTLPSGDVTFTGNKMVVNTGDWAQTAQAGHSDANYRVVVTYNALVTGTGGTLNASGWSSATSGNTTLTDSYSTASSEGLSFTSTTATISATSTATANVSGQANSFTVTNPLVTETITASPTGTVYSGELLTYTITLKNTSTTATAYDVGSTLQMPTGLSYVNGSLEGNVGLAYANSANVALNGAAPTADALGGITLAPGATATVLFTATVNNNLPAADVLTVKGTPDWNSLPANASLDAHPNSNAQAYVGKLASEDESVSVITPTLTIIGESNNTAGLGTSFDPQTSISAVPGEIVRMRAVLQVPEGQNANADIQLVLPNGLTFANDGSAGIVLLSPTSGLATTAALASAGGGGLEINTGGSTVLLGKLDLGIGGGSDPVASTLNPAQIATSGQTTTISLGTLSNNDNSAHPNYVVVEFNAVVSTLAANATVATPAMHGDANSAATGTVSDTINVVAPVVSLSKSIMEIDNNPDGSVTVFYLVTMSNTGGATAYQLAVDDPGAGGHGTVTPITYSGAVPTAMTVTGANHVSATLAALASGTTESFTYSVNIPAAQLSAAVLASTNPATLSYSPFNPNHETGTPAVEFLAGTTAAPVLDNASAAAGLDEITGTVNQDLSATSGADTSLLPLAGQAIAATFTGELFGNDAVTTQADGSYTLIVPSAVQVVLKSTVASPPASTLATLDNGAALTGALPTASVATGTADQATLTFTPAAGSNYSAVNFDYWRAPDSAPHLANGPGSAFTTPTGTAITPFATATVSDAELDTTFGHDYSGTTLTIQRYVSGVASPDATDVFAGSGTAGSGVFLAGTSVKINNTVVGSYTETGGVLTIVFASGATNVTVNSVLQGITYTSTAGGNSALPGIVIGAQIDDANSDAVPLNGSVVDAKGVHDQGPGGDLLSNVLTANVTVNPPAPVLSIVGESNQTATGAPLFDPVSTVTATDGDIVRMRAEVQLPEGGNSNVALAVTLANGLNFQNDGSVTVLLVTPGGNATTVLAGSNLQLAENVTPTDLTLLGHGTGGTDPVLAKLGGGDITQAGQLVTFNLGTINNPSTAAGPNYVIVEFNAVVGSSVAATTTPLSSSLTATSNGSTTAAVHDYVAVVAPDVTVTKTVNGIVNNPDGSVTVTYTDTVSNSGNAPAYGVTLVDPGAGPGTTASYTGPGASGTVTQVGASGNDFTATLSSVPASGSHGFTYTVTIPVTLVPLGVPDSVSTVTVTSSPLNPAHETGGNDVLSGTTVAPPTDTASAAAGLDAISGTVNQDTAALSGTDTPLVGLAGQSVGVVFTNQTVPETVTTKSDGSYTVLVPDNVSNVTLTVAPTVPASDALDNKTALVASVPSGSETGTNPAVLSFTPAAAGNTSGVNFDFWTAPDSAPVLGNGPTGTISMVAGTALKPFSTATVSDAQLDATFGHDYSGTTLTIQRYVSGVASPDGTDVFSATGTATSGLYLSNGSNGSGNVLLAGVAVGSYSETGGVLTIKFASGSTNTTVNAVLEGITYASSAGGNKTLPQIVIGAQIDDANNDPVATGGNAVDPTGPHDQGVGGDMLSKVMTATFTINPAAPVLSIVGESNQTATATPLFDPVSTVTTTDGDIVRMRAEIQLPEGANSNVAMAVTLASGLTFQNDGSVTVLLVTPGGNATTGLTGTGLQLNEVMTAATLGKLGLGTGGTDPVVTTLAGNDITSAGQVVTFNLGNISNPNAVPGANYVIVEFNAVVGGSVAATVSPLASNLQGSSNGTSTAIVHDYINVVAPNLSVSKVVDGIVNNPDGSVTVTYTDTVSNSGNAPAYAVTLVDPGAGPGTTASYTGPGASGTVTQVGASGNDFTATLSSVPASGSHGFTYTVIIPVTLVPLGVPDSAGTVTVTSSPLNPAHETGGIETLSGTSAAPPIDTANASAGLDAISGTVNQDTGATAGTDTPLVGLAGQTVSATFTGQTGTDTVTTASDGSYTVLVPDQGGPVTLTVTTASPGAPANDALDNKAVLLASVPSGSESGSNPAALGFTPAAATNIAAVNFDFWAAPDTAPTLANGVTSALAVVPGGSVTPFPNATVSDTQLDGSFNHDYSGTTLTIQRYLAGSPSPNAADIFSAAGTAGSGVYFSAGPAAPGVVMLNGVTVASYREASGVLSISFAASGITNATVNAVLNGITYSSAAASNTLVPGMVIGAQIDDANADPVATNGNALDPSGPHDQGVGGDMLSNVLTATIDLNNTGPAATFTEPNDASPSGVAVAVNPGIDLSGMVATGTLPQSATLSIANPRAEDVLRFTNTADITGSYANGTMTLTAVAGRTPTLAEWQAALRGVQYFDSSDVPAIATRSVTLTVSDGSNSASDVSTIVVVPVNDSPILNTAIVPTLNDATEYQGSATPVPVGAVGTLVSQLVGTSGTPGNVTDPDGAGLTNGATPGAMGMAITAASTSDAGGRSVGGWYYSTDNGATWTAFPTTLSATRPLDLAATARIVFQPTATDFNGQIPNAITFRAWDGFDGTSSGTQANLAGATLFGQDAAANSAAGAYSIATVALPLMIDNVNNAPDASGATVTLPSVSTAEQHPPGETVAQLFAAGFSDPADSQYVAGANPAGSLANGFAGVAVTGNAASASQGVWEYSTNGGTSWTAIPTGVSQANAVILPGNALVAFQPEGGFSGHPGELTVHLIDSSATPIAPGLTGAQLAAEGSKGVALAAVTGVNIAAYGGASAFSTGTMSIDTQILPLPPVQQSSPVADLVAPPADFFPDDQSHAPTGLEFWRTDDWLGRPLIPDLSLVGSVANRFIIVDQHAVISVPPNIFQDSLPNAQLSYEAKMPDGSSLPSWISFNANDLTFSGTPPFAAHGRLEILIRARDIAGNSADANFTILIGREHNDLMPLTRGNARPRLVRPLHAGDPGAALQEAAAAMAQAEHQIAGHAARLADIHTHAAGLAALPAPAAQAGGFSAALRAQGPMSALGRARAWLDRINDMDRHTPAG